MEKLVYVVWKRVDQREDGFVKAMREDAARRLCELGARGLSLHLVDGRARAAERVRISHLAPPPSGLVSFWLDSADECSRFEQELAALTQRMAGYLVTESVPLENTAHVVPLGERTPGIVMVALLERPERLGFDEWIEIWHRDHREVALETQCTFRYVRNVVVRAVTRDAPSWAGIVEEAFPEDAVTDPLRWYRTGGSPEKLRVQVGRMIASCKRFLDLERVESHPMSEYRITES